ncbi:MAG: hypothetical protein U0R68_07945 [Candidatus Nanopelagicales bacterium]
MSSIVEPRAPKPLPSVTVQIARGALAAGVVVLVAILVTAATTGRQPWAGERWAQLFGDPQIALAPGVVPSEAAATSSVITVDPSVVRLDERTLEKAFGAPVRRITTAAELRRAGVEPVDADTLAHQRWWSTPIGVASVLDTGPGEVPMLVLRSGVSGPVLRSAEDRAALARRFSDALGFTAAPVVPERIGVTIDEEQIGGSIEVSSALTSGSDRAVVGLLGPNRLDIAPDGRLRTALIWVAPAVSTTPVTVSSAATAYDDLRHHRADFGGSWGPVTIDRFELSAGIRSAGGEVVFPAGWTVSSGEESWPINELGG